MRVFKFGGASVKDAEGIKNLVKVLEETGHQNTFLVVSAMGKMTNAMEAVVNAYFDKRLGLKKALEEVVLSPDRFGVVEPTVLHEVAPQGKVSFHVEFYREPF